MANENPYQTPETEEPPASSTPRFGTVNWDFKTRLFFLVPGILLSFSGILLRLLRNLGIPTPESGPTFIGVVVIASVFSTRYVLRKKRPAWPAITLTFVSHCLLQTVTAFGLTVAILLVSNVL